MFSLARTGTLYRIGLSGVREVSSEDFREDFEAPQLGKLGEVETIEKDYKIESAPARATVERHGAHGAVVHAEELADQCSLVGFEVIGMVRKDSDEGCGLKVEIGAGLPVINIGHKPQKTREVKEKDDVEVGIARLGLIKPTKASNDEIKEEGVLLLGAQGMEKKIREEQTYG